MRYFRIILLLTFLVLFYCAVSTADVKLSALISDNMVLQRGMNARIWGWADPGERVTVELSNSRKSTAAGNNGSWSVELDPMKAGGPYKMSVTGNNSIVIENVLVGDIWVCSGQSNMEWHVKYSDNAEKEIADGNYPMIRLFRVKKAGAGEPAG
ncbi:MAG: sialate O-acetylesterase, partial [Candidatus Latescibacteria bacterium]|nr:sialate O-acetylesterase [Candidatus Latescibacterota bacterium]